jgi:hypothetical protein
MKTIFALLSCMLATMSILAEPIIPTQEGMSWHYVMTQEAGEAFRFSDLKPDDDGKVRAGVIYRLSGTENIDGKNVLKFEMHRAGVVTNTDLVTVSEQEIICAARIDQDGQMTRLSPPQTMIAAPLKTGTSWDFDSEIAGSKVHQHYSVIGEEDVVVPAGKFRAFKIHGEQTSPNSMIIDRWFVKGVGIVKDVTTTRTESGDLVRRILLELKEKPKVAARPEVKPMAAPQKLSGTVGKEAVGEPTTNFSSDTPKIYARWRGQRLRDQARIRVVWIAEDVGEVAPPGYTIDEATTTATAPDSHGIFTLARPEEGWAPGAYRVEFYLDDALAETVKLKIGK